MRMSITALYFVQTGTAFLILIAFLTLKPECQGFHLPLVGKPTGQVKLLAAHSDRDFFRFAEILTDNSKEELFSSKLRRDGRKLLSMLPLPHEKDEAWRFTNIRKLFSARPLKNAERRRTIETSFLASKVDISSPSLLFVDGEYFGTLNEQSQCDFFISNLGNALSSTIEDDVFTELTFVPQKGCLPRESFGSELLSALNMVSFNI